MSRRVLVTGAGGFTGRWMLRELERRGAEAIGLSRSPQQHKQHAWLVADLLDGEATARAIEASRPDGLIHLASRTPANPPALGAAQWIHEAAAATLNILDAMQQYAPQARTLLVSSSAVYGHIPAQHMPIVEDRMLKPTTIYGVAKATQELIAARFFGEFQLPIMIARPFNLVGVGEPRSMLTSNLASQIADAQRNATQATISLRHRVTQRDYTDIRDAVRAYWLLLEHGQPGETYNVCSGQATSIGQVLDDLLAIAGVEAIVRETSSGPGPNDILVQQGSHDALTSATGWQPEYTLRDSLRDLLAHM